MPSGLTLATGSEGEFEKEEDGYRVQLVFEEHPKTGPNEIGIRITDPGGNPLLGAAVEVSPVQAAIEQTDGETEKHGEAQIEHDEVHSGNHNEPVEEIESGHTDASSMDEHKEAESMAEGHQEMEAEDHEETGGHSESKNVFLQASGESGHYTGKITFPEPGEWSVVVRVVPENDMVEKELIFPVDVIAASPPWGVLAAFLGINFTVVSVAGFLKRKPSTAK
jgi:hypothetical protein